MTVKQLREFLMGLDKSHDNKRIVYRTMEVDEGEGASFETVDVVYEVSKVIALENHAHVIADGEYLEHLKHI